MKKVSLVSRALVFLKGGDEAKLIRFESKLEKYFIKQIALRKEQISNLQDKIADAYEAVDEAVVTVAADRIKDTDTAEAYCKTYVQAVESKIDAVEVLESQIEAVEKEIAKLEKIQARIYNVEEA